MTGTPPRAAVSAADLQRLREHARAAAHNAYAPYSRFPVGAALLAADGRLVSACNVENASFGLSMCAERVALFAAVAQGARDIVAVAVYAPTGSITPPCGACRQVLNELAPHALVLCCNDDDAAERRYDVPQLLPDAFGPGNL
jgi:cytidine deaminase